MISNIGTNAVNTLQTGSLESINTTLFKNLKEKALELLQKGGQNVSIENLNTALSEILSASGQNIKELQQNEMTKLTNSFKKILGQQRDDKSILKALMSVINEKYSKNETDDNVLQECLVGANERNQSEQMGKFDDNYALLTGLGVCRHKATLANKLIENSGLKNVEILDVNNSISENHVLNIIRIKHGENYQYYEFDAHNNKFKEIPKDSIYFIGKDMSNAKILLDNKKEALGTENRVQTPSASAYGAMYGIKKTKNTNVQNDKIENTNINGFNNIDHLKNAIKLEKSGKYEEAFEEYKNVLANMNSNFKDAYNTYIKDSSIVTSNGGSNGGLNHDKEYWIFEQMLNCKIKLGANEGEIRKLHTLTGTSSEDADMTDKFEKLQTCENLEKSAIQYKKNGEFNKAYKDYSELFEVYQKNNPLKALETKIKLCKLQDAHQYCDYDGNIEWVDINSDIQSFEHNKGLVYLYKDCINEYSKLEEMLGQPDGFKEERNNLEQLMFEKLFDSINEADDIIKNVKAGKLDIFQEDLDNLKIYRDELLNLKKDLIQNYIQKNYKNGKINISKQYGQKIYEFYNAKETHLNLNDLKRSSIPYKELNNFEDFNNHVQKFNGKYYSDMYDLLTSETNGRDLYNKLTNILDELNACETTDEKKAYFENNKDKFADLGFSTLENFYATMRGEKDAQ